MNIKSLQKIKCESGFSLLEVMIYIAISGIITTAAVSYFTNTMRSYGVSRSQLVLNNNELTLRENLSQSLKFVDEIDDLNSRFLEENGKISVLVNGDSVTFQLEDSRLYKSINDGNKIPITGNDIKVTKFLIDKWGIENGSEQVEVTLDFESRGYTSAEATRTVKIRVFTRPRVFEY